MLRRMSRSVERWVEKNGRSEGGTGGVRGLRGGQMDECSTTHGRTSGAQGSGEPRALEGQEGKKG